MDILVIDVGGSAIKVLATGHKEPVKIPSGPKLTAKQMVRSVQEATRDWRYDVVSIGIPGKVLNGQPAENPPNLGRGWMRFNYQKAFGKPVKVMNDAAMQALGNYNGKRMLFLGLGTGLGSALVIEGILHPLELGDLPYKEGSYADYVGAAGLERIGKREWTRHVREVVRQLASAMQTDSIVIGGGKAKLITRLPCRAIRSDNSSAFTGGFRLWR